MIQISAHAETFPIAGRFTISRGSRTEAHVVRAVVTDGTATGHGECVPYARYGETVESVMAQIADCAVRSREEAQSMPAGAARNAVDCAFWDFEAKRSGKPVWQLAGLAAPQPIVTAYTLSLDTPDAMRAKAAENAARPLLKIKLGGEGDLARLEAVRAGAPEARIIVDANEGWTAESYAALAPDLLRLGVTLVEQPLPAADDAVLKEIERPIPVCADESCHDRASLAAMAGKYDFINIKLDKTGGLTEALALRAAAEAAGLRIMVGCMIGTSLAMAPGVLLAQGAPVVDLDAPLLLAGDRASPLRYEGSVAHPPDAALWGQGITMTRRISGHEVFPVGFGCMNMSGGYTPRVSDEACDALLNRALDLGVTLMDTAAVYGAGHSETMIGKYISKRRAEYTLCTKWGFSAGGTTGKRGIDNDPRRVAGCCEESLRNLKTDVIDLWYLHRWDKETPIEEVIGEMGRMVEQGKVRTLGLSEVSAQTLRKAHAEHPIAAVQSEYSLWTRNPEIAVRDACEELGAAFVAFSPLARQFLTDVMDPAPVFTEGDIRIGMPRFEGEDYAANRRLLDDYRAIAARANCTPGQLALAWVLAQGEHVIPIPGTQKIAHLEENTEAAQVELDPDIVAELDDLINQQRVRGGRYPDRLQAQIDTEEFEAGES